MNTVEVAREAHRNLEGDDVERARNRNDAVLQTGMKGGVSESFWRLAKYLRTMAWR